MILASSGADVINMRILEVEKAVENMEDERYKIVDVLRHKNAKTTGKSAAVAFNGLAFYLRQRTT